MEDGGIGGGLQMAEIYGATTNERRSTRVAGVRPSGPTLGGEGRGGLGGEAAS